MVLPEKRNVDRVLLLQVLKFLGSTSKPVGQVENQPAKRRADNYPKVLDPIPIIPYSVVNNTPQKKKSNASERDYEPPLSVFE